MNDTEHPEPIDPKLEPLTRLSLTDPAPIHDPVPHLAFKTSWKEPWFLALAGGAVTCVIALVTVTIALVGTINSRNDLQVELSCRTASAVVVDAAKAEQLKVIGQTLADIQDGLGAVAVGDNEALLIVVNEHFPENRTLLDQAAQVVEEAVEDREDSITSC